MRAWQAVTDDLVSLARAFHPPQLDARSACGDWTNRQLLAHLATGYSVRISALQAAIGGARASAIDVDRANAADVIRLQGAPTEAIIADLVQVRGRVLELLSKLKPEHLATRTSLGGGKTLGEALGGLSAHDLQHAAELRG